MWPRSSPGWPGKPRRTGSICRSGHVLPGAVAALTALAAAGGANGTGAVHQSVLTGNIRPLAEVKLGAFGLTGLLELDIGAYGDSHEARSELVHVARERARAVTGTGFGGESTVLIGDTPLDVAALATGARAVGVATGGYTEADLAAAGAHAVLPTWPTRPACWPPSGPGRRPARPGDRLPRSGSSPRRPGRRPAGPGSSEEGRHVDYSRPEVDGDSGPCGPGFLFHCRVHPGGPGMSDVSSAGIARGAPGYGTTCRKDVLGGVDVPVVPGAAGWASPLPGGKAQDREQVPARRAGLGRGVPAVDDDQAAAVPSALVFQLAAELAPPAVRDCAGEVPVADHAGDVEVFDHDQVGASDQAGAGAVQEVRPAWRTLRCARATMAAALARLADPFWQRARRRWYRASLRALRSRWRGLANLLPAGGHGEVGHAQVDADGTPGLPAGVPGRRRRW